MNAPARTASTFSFKAGTEAAKFVTSNNDVDFLFGALGSGKSKALCMRIMRHAQEQDPSPIDGLRYTRFAIVRNCYDDQTEILTERGFKFFSDLLPEDKVAQLRDGTMEFVVPIERYSAPYVGQMIGFENEGVDFVVTPDHRMWSSRLTKAKGWLSYEFRTAAQIYGNGECRVTRSADWNGSDGPYDSAMFEWLGFWFAEGSSGVYPCADGYTRHQCVITQVKKDGIAYAERLFAAAGLPMTKAVRPDAGVTLRLGVTEKTKPIIAELSKTGTATTKRVPAWVKAASKDRIRAFIKGFVAGDGHINGRGVVTAYTSSAGLASDLQELALRAGMVANLTSRDRRGVAVSMPPGYMSTATEIQWTITFVGERKYQPRLKVQGYAERYRGWYKKIYSGYVYCVTVPTHIVFVRRNGKAFWCGQTMPDLKRSTIRTWLETFPEAIYGRFTYGANMHHKIRYPWGGGDVNTEVDFISLDKSEDVKKLRSTEYTGIAFNEIPFIDKELFDEADSRLRYPPAEHCVPNRFGDRNPKWRGLLADGNAPDEDHWLATMAFGLEPPPGTPEDQLELYRWPDGWGFYKQPPALIEKFDERGVIIGYDVNPNAENIANLPSDYYQRQLRSKSKAWIDSRLMCRVALVVEGQPVWPMFRREYHVSREALKPVPGNEVLVALDFGRVRPAALFGQQIGQRFFIQYEMIGSNEPASVFAPRVKRFLTQHYPGFTVRFVGDPKGRDKGQQSEQSSYDIFAAHGMKVYPAPVKQNDIETRTEAVAVALNDNPSGIPLVTISPVCRTLIVGCSGRYHLEREDAGVLKPCKDKYSDICDALQYWVLDRGVGRKMIGLTPAGDVKPVRVSHGHRSLRRVVR